MNKKASQENVPKFKSSEVKIAIEALRKTDKKIPLMLWGPPGVGKSETVREYCEENNLRLIDYRAVLVDPVDLRGVPTVVKDGEGNHHTVWCVPDEFPKDGEGIFFIDEINSAPQSVQAAFYQLTNDRKVGQYELPDGWYVMAAGNRETDRAVVNRMPSALANRFTHAEFLVNLNDWVDWAIKKGIDPELIAFLRYRSPLLNNLDPDLKVNPTPRTWEHADQIQKVSPPDIADRMIAGTVGEGASLEFRGFKDIVNQLPPLAEVINDPLNADVSKDPAVLYALAGALARQADDQNIAAIYAYLERCPKEFLIIGMRDAIKFNPAIQETSTFVNFVTNNQEVLVN